MLPDFKYYISWKICSMANIKCIQCFMIAVTSIKWMMFLGNVSAPKGYTGPGTTWANEMNVVMNIAISLVQDRSLDLLISSEARFDCDIDTPF